MLYNATGVRKKMEAIKNYMRKENIDITLITETWIKNEEYAIPKGLMATSFYSNGSNRGQSGTGFIIDEDKWGGKIQIVESDPIKGLYSIIEIQNLVVVVIYLPPSLNIEETIQVLSTVIDKAESRGTDQIVIGGDFNCKLAELNQGISCIRGKEIEEEMRLRGFNLHNNDTEFTNFCSGCNPTIIDLWWSSGVVSQRTAKTDVDTYLGRSSHRPVILEISAMRGISPNAAIVRRVCRIERLKDPDIKNLVSAALKEPLFQLTEEIREELERITESNVNDNEDIKVSSAKWSSKFEEKLHDSIKKKTEEICGMKLVFRKRSRHIENARTMELSNKTNALNRLAVRNSQNFYFQRKREECLQELEAERESIKRKAFNEFDNKVATLKKQEQQKLFKRLVKTRLGNTEAGLESTKETMETAARYFISLFKNNEAIEKHTGFTWGKTDEDVIKLAEKIFQEDLIENLIKWAPSNKAPGFSGITNEMLRINCKQIASLLSYWFKYCFICGSIPAGWKKAIIVPIFKKGIKTDISNYRPISLLETSR